MKNFHYTITLFFVMLGCFCTGAVLVAIGGHSLMSTVLFAGFGFTVGFFAMSVMAGVSIAKLLIAHDNAMKENK